MKKLTLFALLAVLVFGVCGCSQNTGDGVADDRFGLRDDPINARIVMDDVTGVYYLIVSDGDSIGVTVLVNSDGSPCRVDNIDFESAKADIESNNRRFIQDLLKA